MSIVVIAFCGAKGSGKDTFAASVMARAKRPAECHKLSFATTLKDMIRALVKDDEWMGRAELDKETIFTPWGQTYRRLLQTLGTEWARKMMSNSAWTNIAEVRLNVLANHPRPDSGMSRLVFITDLRFPNELRMLGHNYMTVVVQIDRPGHGFKYMSKWDKVLHYLWIKRVHESEIPLNLEHYGRKIMVKNSGTVNGITDYLVEELGSMIGRRYFN